jgi:hypothetical protein
LREDPHGPPILRLAVSLRRPRKAWKRRLPKRPLDAKETMPRRAVERGRKSASGIGQRDRGVSGRPPGLGPGPSPRFALRRGLGPLGRLIDRAAHPATGGDQAARCPAFLQGLLRQGDALRDARLPLSAPIPEDQGPGDPDPGRQDQDPDQGDPDQGDPDQDRSQDELAQDLDQGGRMDDPVGRPVPRAPAILPTARLGLRLPVTVTARQHVHPLSALPGRRNRGNGQARPQPGRAADRVANPKAGLAENRAASQVAGQAGNQKAGLAENQAASL